MKKIISFSIAILFAIITVNAQETEWISDQSHSTIQFSVSHLVISETTGLFTVFESVVSTNNEDFEDANISVSVDVKSLNTNDSKRDAHLLSADFFNVTEFRYMNFTSTSFKKVSGKNYKLKGNLTIKDVTKEIEFDVVYGGTVTDPYGNVKAVFNLNGKINRFDYGLQWNTLLESGGAVVGEEVTIDCNIEFNKGQ